MSLSGSGLAWVIEGSCLDTSCFLMFSCAPQASAESCAKWMRMSAPRILVITGDDACSAQTQPCMGVSRPPSQEPSASITPLASFASVLWALPVSYALSQGPDPKDGSSLAHGLALPGATLPESTPPPSRVSIYPVRKRALLVLVWLWGAGRSHS